MDHGFTVERRRFHDVERQVWTAGSGPPIVVMHEVPNLHPGVITFGRALVDAGFRVVMPSLLGTPGRPLSMRSTVRSISRACVSREFTVWATGSNSPITDWLRALALDEHTRSGLPVGAIGMCLTGGFALAMMVDDHVQAPVLSQPSLPFAVFPHQARDLGVDTATLTRVKERCDAGVCVLGLRFSHDRMVPRTRFDRLRDELGEGFLAVEIDSSFGNPHSIPIWAHSVVAADFVDEPGHPTHDALKTVIAFFDERLRPPRGHPGETHRTPPTL